MTKTIEKMTRGELSTARGALETIVADVDLNIAALDASRISDTSRRLCMATQVERRAFVISEIKAIDAMLGNVPTR